MLTSRLAVKLCNKQESDLWSYPTIRLPGFNLQRSTWSTPNRFSTGQGRCAANLHKWHMAPTDRCQCGDVQTMIHNVESCPLTRFADVDLFRLHSADDGAVTWLQDIAAKALAKWNECWPVDAGQTFVRFGKLGLRFLRGKRD